MKVLRSAALAATLFLSSAASATLVDFQGCGTSTIVVGVNVSVSNTSGPCMGIPAGVSFTAPVDDGLYIAAAGQSSNPTTALGLNSPLGGDLTITLASLTSSFAFDLFQNFTGGAQSGSDASFLISLFNGGSPVGSYNVAVPSGTGTSFSATSLNPFNSITVSQAGGFAVLDNFSFGESAVPEPGTWAMMLLGFGGIGFAMRRRPRRVALSAA